MAVGFSVLRSRIEQILNPEWIVPLTHPMWEERILPVFFELEKARSLQRIPFQISGSGGLYIGNLSGDTLLNSLSLSGDTLLNSTELSKVSPDISLYVLSNITDLSILRRLKDYPDETERSELESFWVAECTEANAMLIINP